MIPGSPVEENTTMKFKKGARLLLIMAAMLLYTSIEAANAEEAPRFYAGLFGGYVMPSSMTWKINDSDSSFDINVNNGSMYGLKVGMFITEARFLALEGELSYIRQHDIPDQIQSGVRFMGDISLLNGMVNLILRYPDGIIHPFIGLGAGGSVVKIDDFESFSAHVGFEGNESKLGGAAQVLAGVNYEIMEGFLSADLTWRYFTALLKFSMVDVTYRAQEVTLGINMHF